MENIAANIRKIREIKGLSQEFIAERLGLSQNAYSKIERGEVKLSSERLTQISSILEVSEEIIRNFSEQVIFNSCSQSGYYNHVYINPIEEIKMLYERLLKEKDMRIQELHAQLGKA
jgi:transcriptional regulator with XRE-family HTH domain